MVLRLFEIFFVASLVAPPLAVLFGVLLLFVPKRPRGLAATQRGRTVHA